MATSDGEFSPRKVGHPIDDVAKLRVLDLLLEFVR